MKLRGDAKGLIKALRHKDAAVRDAAAAALGEMGESEEAQAAVYDLLEESPDLPELAARQGFTDPPKIPPVHLP